MKLKVILLASLFFYGIRAKGQHGITVIGDYVNQKCFNCDQAQLNIYLQDLCRKSDSILSLTNDRFFEKIRRENFEARKRKKIKREYTMCLKKLRRVREKAMDLSVSLNGDNTTNDYHRGLLYLYITHSIVTTLSFLEQNTFGDFYIAPALWEK